MQIRRTFSRKVGSGIRLPLGFFRISHRIVNSSENTRYLTGRWCKITFPEQKKTIYRILRFDPQLSGKIDGEDAEILIDYDGWIELMGVEENLKGTAELEISEARGMGKIQCHLTHPDPTHRFASQIACLSIFISLISILVALI
jgi:hypothetical protein